MAALAAFLVELLTNILTKWGEDAVTGKLSAPMIIHNAVPTPAADKVVGDAMVADILPK